MDPSYLLNYTRIRGSWFGIHIAWLVVATVSSWYKWYSNALQYMYNFSRIGLSYNTTYFVDTSATAKIH